MSSDWKDALAALKGSMPHDDTPDGATTSAPESTPRQEASQQTPLTVILDRKGRKGKTATIIEGFKADDNAVAETARILKQKIGTGGSSRGGEILLQGDWRERAATLLRDMGYKVRII
ncbi:MAG: translation initiation factor [Muribaculaceae bacterium]|nr:translation initiation factor [Muribaculaceae bacterium]